MSELMGTAHNDGDSGDVGRRRAEQRSVDTQKNGARTSGGVGEGASAHKKNK